MADALPEELQKLVSDADNSIGDTLLKYGLYVGAVFQLICIFAAIFLPNRSDKEDESTEEYKDERQRNTSHRAHAGDSGERSTNQHKASATLTNRNTGRKHDKKKKR